MKKLFNVFLLFIVIFIFSSCKSSNKIIKIVLKAPTLSFVNSIMGDDVKSSYDFLYKASQAFIEEYALDNVEFEIVQYDNTCEIEAIDNCYNTCDACDVLLNDYHIMKSHIYSGNVIPVNDLVDENLINDVSLDIWNLSKVNGKLYMLPFYYRQNVLAYNKGLFKKCGLDYFIKNDVISTWTLDEWDYILKKLREGLSPTSYPLMMYSLNDQGDTHVMSLIRAFGSEFSKDNKMILEEDEGLKGLKWLKKCYDNGYIPDNSYDIDVLSNLNLFLNNQLAIFVCNAAIENIYNDVGFVDFPYITLGCCTNYITGFEIFDNHDEKKLDVSKKFVKFIYNSEFIEYSTAAIPCFNSVYLKYINLLDSLKKYINNQCNNLDITGDIINWLDIRNIFYKYMQSLFKGEYDELEIAKNFDKEANELIYNAILNIKLHS